MREKIMVSMKYILVEAVTGVSLNAFSLFAKFKTLPAFRDAKSG
jgi:hypothetical protein